jgi:ATP-dependent DNA helicase RecG
VQFAKPHQQGAILNAIVHRDYNDAGNIQIRIFDDFIEIWRPGMLPKELDIKNLTKNNRSIPLNKQILKLFHLAREIENWGTGFARIYDACTLNSNPPPQSEERA